MQAQPTVAPVTQAPATEAVESVLRRVELKSTNYPAYVVWELTLACDQPCTHCGSRAGTQREGELSTPAALEVVEQLATAGTLEVVLIGGEAYLHPGFLDIIAALKARGVRASMTTGGRGVTAALASDMARAGLHGASVSIDGLESTHDLMRATKGSFQSATAALGHLKAAGIRIAANTNVNRLNEGDLEGLYLHLKAQGVVAWQLQITAPLGRAADRAAMLLQPWDLLQVVPRVVALKRRAFDEARMVLMPGNNLGYFGPEEAALRSPLPGGSDHWQGCQAGKLVAGIESNGAFKGCPSLQSAYIGGNLKEKSIQDIWDHAPELAFTRHRTVDDLWGFCRACPFAATCLGGCSFTAHALFGRPGNNPYCHYRARSLAAQGKRERLVLKENAPGKPFDHGAFDIVLEPIDALDVKPPVPHQLVRKHRV